jgi:hypothetical protein
MFSKSFLMILAFNTLRALGGALSAGYVESNNPWLHSIDVQHVIAYGLSSSG